MDKGDGREAARELGAALRGHRVRRGLSLRAMAKQVGLSGHGTLVDYEHGRRIPPEDLLTAWERALEITDGSLRALRRAALAARAEQQSAVLLGARTVSEPASPAGPAPPVDVVHEAVPPGTARPWWFRWPAWVAAVFVLAGGSIGAALWPHAEPTQSAARPPVLRIGFETAKDRWVILWGSRTATGQVTGTFAYEGTHCYELSIHGASEHGYVAFGTTHGLESLHSGMRVTMHLWTSYPTNGVRFFVYNERSVPVWAPETPDNGSEVPVSGGTQWSTVSWTVPPVSKVTAIGIQPYAENDIPRVVAVDAVSW